MESEKKEVPEIKEPEKTEDTQKKEEGKDDPFIENLKKMASQQPKEEEPNLPKEPDENGYYFLTEGGGVKKKILKEGTGEKCGNKKKAFVFFKSHLKGSSLIYEQTIKEPYEFTIGNGEVMRGLEIGVKYMKKGEKSELLIESSYGPHERERDRKEEDRDKVYIYEIELIDIKDPETDIYQMGYEEKLYKAKNWKSEGVLKFKEGEMEWAIEKFKKGVRYALRFDFTNNEEKEGLETCVQLYTNIANCCNHLKQYDDTIKYISELFQKVGRASAKSFYFRAIAYANVSEFEKAEADLKELSGMIGENDSGVKFVKDLISNKKKEVQDRKKKFSKGVFTKMSVYDDKEILKKLLPVPEGITNKINPVVFLDIQIGAEFSQRVEIELFQDKVPKTAENFRQLCTGQKGEHLWLKNTYFHKLYKDDLVLGGDIDGNGGESIYGKCFDDENFYYRHSCDGLLTMFNQGKDTNGSQFYITLRQQPKMDEKNVIFGKVIKGIEVIWGINKLESDSENKPSSKVKIVNCGEIQRQQPDFFKIY